VTGQIQQCSGSGIPARFGPVFSFRVAEPADARALGEALVAGFEGYRSFAPESWEPPGALGEVERFRTLLEDADAWFVVAERDGEVVGHSGFQPARTSMVPVEDDDLAHLRALFVDEEWWGSGLASELHGRALVEAARRGYGSIRLFTPAGQARARRFYEREGWQQDGEPRESGIGIMTVEYRRKLP
jgi:GNAT superfamily N-acetyltransferase